MARLKDCYGDRVYPVERETQIWFWAKRLDEKLFNSIVGNLIANCERPPLLGKFKEAYGELKSAHASSEKSPMKCYYCGDHGTYAPFSPLDPLGCVYSCRCDAGLALAKIFKPFGGQLVRQYPTAGELVWGQASQTKKIITQALETMK